MSPRRAPDERGPFLGTEQIIKRLREVRRPPWRGHVRRTLVLGACTSAVLMASVVVFERLASYRRQHTGHAAPSAEVQVPLEVESHVGPSLEATYDPPPAARVPQRQKGRTDRSDRSDRPERTTRSERPAAPHRLRTRQAPQAEATGAPSDDAGAQLSNWGLGEDASPPPKPPSPDDPATVGRVRIEIHGPPGSIFVDGKRVALDTRWDMDLPHGDHHLMVRVGGRSMTYKLRLRGAGAKVVFDDQGSEIREESWQPRARGP